MKTETREVFVAFDGKAFASADECRAYEKENGDALLIDMSVEDLAAVLEGKDAARADAIERFARKWAAARIERGERKRKARTPKDRITSITPSVAGHGTWQPGQDHDS